MIWLLLVILLIFLIVGISRGNKKKKLEIAEMQAKSNQPSPAEQPNASVADELMKIKSLKDCGILTDDEFEAEKRKLLNK